MDEKTYKIGTYTNPFAWAVGVGIVAGCFVWSAVKGTIDNVRKVLE